MPFHSDDLVTDEILTKEEIVSLNRWLLHLLHEIAGYPYSMGPGYQEYNVTSVSTAIASTSPKLAQAYILAREVAGKRRSIRKTKTITASETWQQLARDNPRMIGLAFNLGAAGFTKKPPDA